MRDPEVVARIIESIAPTPADNLLEIGPGRGALTRPLLARARRLAVIEIDRDLACDLRTWDVPGAHLRVYCEDALHFDFARAGAGVRVVGNLPYNVSTPLLLRLTRFHARVRDAHFMLQREVVARLAAQPGDAAYSRLSVFGACCFDVCPLFEVRPEAFAPKPQVVSSFVRLSPKPAPSPALLERLDSLVKLAFSRRRKTVANALAPLFDRQALERFGIDPGQRPQTLRVDQFMKMLNNSGDQLREVRHAKQTL